MYDDISPDVEVIAWKAEQAVRHWLQNGGFAQIEQRERECRADGGDPHVLPEAVLMEGIQYLVDIGYITIADPAPVNPRPARRWPR